MVAYFIQRHLFVFAWEYEGFGFPMPTGDLEDLSRRLAQLSVTHRSAPLVTVDFNGGSISRQESDAHMLDSKQQANSIEGKHNEGWELL